MGTLSFEPLIPPVLWLTLALAGAALLAWYGWRRPGALTRRRWRTILVLMSASLALVLLILLNPTWIAPLAPPGGKPLLTILVDETASMATADAPHRQTRYQAAATLTKACAEQLGDRYEVRTGTFAGSVTRVDAADLGKRLPTGAVTDLAAALTESIVESREQGQALMLFSDGIHNAGSTAQVLDAVRVARAMACPVYTHTIGGDPQVRDLAVELPSPQEMAFIGQKLSVPVRLKQRGFTGARATLVLTHADKEVERRVVTVPKAEATEVRFEVGQDKPGVYRYEVRVEPLPGEASQANNRATLLVRVMDKPVRVLFLEGKPYWDAKFLMRTLLGDASIELDAVVRIGDNRLLRRTFRRDGANAPPAAPREEWKIVGDFASVLADGELLKSCQVVVLGRDADGFLTDPVLAQLRNWIARDGGSLVCYRGQPTSQVHQRLAALLPVRWVPVHESRFRVHLTDRGRDVRWFPDAPDAALAPLPTLATSTRAEKPRPIAVVLATAQATEAEDPVVVYQPYGAGRVVVIEGAGMWRWAFLPPTQQQNDEVYRSLWHGLTRWLMASGDLLPGQKMALRSDRVSFGTTEPASATLLLREESERQQVPAVELRGDGIDGAKSITPAPLGDEPGTFRVALGKLPEGRYQLHVAGAPAGDPSASAAFDVRSMSEEQLDLKARPDLMGRIAQESGGAVLEGSNAREIITRFQYHQLHSRAMRVERLSAWDRWWVLLAAFGLWTAAWATRRSAGLV